MTNSHPYKIWDLPTRVFHWTLVFAIAFMWWSAETGGLWMSWHLQVGIFLIALVLWRIVWGFVGSESARFSSFLKSPIQALSHLGELMLPQTAYHAGHNPLGAWMVVALLAVVLAQGITGLFATDDILIEGPFYSLVSNATAGKLTGLHHLLFNILIVLVVLHVTAIVFYRIRKKTNLIKAMVTGSADWPDNQPQPAPLSFKSPWLALALFIGIYAGVYGVIQLLA